MLWQNALLDTRWRFLIGLVLLTVSAAFVVLSYPRVAGLVDAASRLGTAGTLGSEIAAAAALARTYDGYVWSQWFRQNGAQLGSLFAILIGTGGLLAQNAPARLFTLSLPVSRERLFATRAAAGLSQLLLLSVVPALAIWAISPLVAQRFPVLDALVYALCVFAGSTLFYSVSFMLSAMLPNVWAPVVLTLCVGPALGMLDRMTAAAPAWSLLAMMHGETYFRGDGVPWPMLLVSAVLSALLIQAGIRHIARRDF